MPIKITPKQKRTFEAGLKVFPFLISMGSASLSGSDILVDFSLAKDITNGMKAFHTILEYYDIIELDYEKQFENDFIKNIEKATKNNSLGISKGEEILSELNQKLIEDVEQGLITLEISEKEFEQIYITSFINISEEKGEYYTPAEVREYFKNLELNFFKNLKSDETINIEINFEKLDERINDIQSELIELKEKYTGLDVRVSNLEDIKQTQSNIDLLLPPPKKRRDFIGREGELAEYQQILSSSNLVLRGMGGIGKTALIKSLAEQNGSNDKKIAWFDYQGTLQDTLLQEIPVTPENTEIVLAQRKAFLLGLDSSHLLLFDNVEDLSQSEMDFFNQLPSRVLITTRQKLNLASYQEQELEFLSEAQCKQLFLNQTHLKDQNEQALDEQEQQALSQIIILTGFHTLTIELLGNICSQSFEINTIQDLLQELQENSFDLQDDLALYRQNHVFSGSFFKHMQKLFDISIITDSEQRYILTNFCLLPSLPIEGAILKKWLGLENQNAITQLNKSGWIQTQNKSITLHSVLAETLKLSLTPSYEDCQTLIESLAQEINYDYSDINRYNPRFFLHCQAIAQYFSTQHIHEKSLAFLYNNIAGVYQAQGDYPQALAFYQKDLVISEKVLGKEHPNTAATYNNIAGMYYAKGDYPQALAFYQKALAIAEKVLGKEHPSTATTYNNIAGVYKDMGDYPQALVFYEKDLVISEKVLGKEHPDTATTYNNIAGVYYAKRDYPQALKFYEKALAIQEKVLGKQHPDTATTYNNIALVYDDIGDYPQALAFYEKDLAISEKVLGKQHPDTATTYHNIALVYDDMGDYPQALAWNEKALVVREKVLGKKHPDTATTYNNIAGVYQAQGDYPQALEGYQRALAIREKVLGKDHPDTAGTYMNISLVYYELEEYRIAIEWILKAIFTNIKIFGVDHPKTKNSINGLYANYLALGHTEEEFSQVLSDLLSNPLPPPTQED